MSDKPPPYNPYPDGNYPQMGSHPPPYQQLPPQQTQYQPVSPQQTTYIIPGNNSGSTTYVTTQQSYGSIPVVVQPIRSTDVIVVGGCPACRVGVLDDRFSLAGLCCAFWFFPIGILCCLAMRERRCTNCGATYT